MQMKNCIFPLLFRKLLTSLLTFCVRFRKAFNVQIFSKDSWKDERQKCNMNTCSFFGCLCWIIFLLCLAFPIILYEWRLKSKGNVLVLHPKDCTTFVYRYLVVPSYIRHDLIRQHLLENYSCRLRKMWRTLSIIKHIFTWKREQKKIFILAKRDEEWFHTTLFQKWILRDVEIFWTAWATYIVTKHHKSDVKHC